MPLSITLGKRTQKRNYIIDAPTVVVLRRQYMQQEKEGGDIKSNSHKCMCKFSSRGECWINKKKEPDRIRSWLAMQDPCPRAS